MKSKKLTMMSRDKLLKRNLLNEYLLDGNENLIGTVIGFRKGLKLDNLNKWKELNKIGKLTGDKHYLPEGFAVLLYFDHRTAQVERHLFNPNLTFFRRKPHINDYIRNEIETNSLEYVNPYVFNYNQDVFYTRLLDKLILKYSDYKNPTYYELLNSELHRFRDRPLIEITPDEYISLNECEEDFPTAESKSDSSIKRLYDGKITKSMVGIFMNELIRAYLSPLYNNRIKTTLDTHSESIIRWKEEVTDMNILRNEGKIEDMKHLFLDYPRTGNKGVIYIPKGIS